MKRSIASALSQHNHLVRLPERQRRIRQVCRDAAERVRSAEGRPASAAEVAEQTGLPAHIVARAERGPGPVRAIADAEDDGLASLPDEAAPLPGERLARSELAQRLTGCLGALPSEEAEIVRLHFGLGRRRSLSVR